MYCERPIKFVLRTSKLDPAMSYSTLKKEQSLFEREVKLKSRYYEAMENVRVAEANANAASMEFPATATAKLIAARARTDAAKAAMDVASAELFAFGVRKTERRMHG